MPKCCVVFGADSQVGSTFVPAYLFRMPGDWVAATCIERDAKELFKADKQKWGARLTLRQGGITDRMLLAELSRLIVPEFVINCTVLSPEKLQGVTRQLAADLNVRTTSLFVQLASTLDEAEAFAEILRSYGRKTKRPWAVVCLSGAYDASKAAEFVRRVLLYGTKDRIHEFKGSETAMALAGNTGHGDQ